MQRHVERFLRWGAVTLALATSACLVPAPNSGQVVPGPQPSLPTPVTVEYVTTGDPNDLRKIDIYEPDTPGTDRPLIVYVHGGAWMLPGRESIQCGGQPPCNPYTSLPALGMQVDRGYVLASVGYPLLTATTNGHPTQVRNVKLAIKWLVDHAATYGIDPDQIVVAGHSAGGHLAAMTALTPGLYEPTGVAATHVDGFMTLNGPTDLESWAIWGDQPGGGRPAWIADASIAQAGCDHTVPSCVAVGGPMDQASPLFHASAGDPPGYLTCKDWDPFVPCDQLQVLHDKLVTVQGGNQQAAVFDRIACTGSPARPVPCGPESADPIERHNPDFDLNLDALQQWLDGVTN